jgi:serine/threonine-protein kinase
MENAAMTTGARSCTHCHTQLADAAEGLCPPCLLELEPPSSGPPSLERLPRRLGRYELLANIRRGMSVVYRARHLESGEVVALKLILTDGPWGLDEVRLFHAEAEATAQLAHPNIVPVLDIGEVEGRPYFTMPLMAGNLAGRIKELGADPRKAARIVATVAHAVHHAHKGLIIHRDLKPANILLDAAGEPFVADFGVAKHLGEKTLTPSGVAIGTPSYMSPEQAEGQSKRLTTAADVYGLGAILYELLTGRPPFTGETPTAILIKVIFQKPEPPQRFNPLVDDGLETICLKCLQKKPAHRYGSAEELALTIERYLEGEEPVRVGLAERAWRWAGLRPIVAASLLGVAALTVGVLVAALSVARAQETELHHETQRMNEYAARAMAGSVLFQLDTYAEQVSRIAEHPGILAAIRAGECRSNEGAERLLAPLGAGTRFASLILHDAQGVATRRWPMPPSSDFLCKEFSWLTYVRVARANGERGSRSVNVGRVFRSEADGQWRFGLSAPVFDEEGRFVGVVGAGIVTDSRLGTADDLGSLVVGFPGGDTRRTTVLVGPRDNDRDCRDCPLPEDSLVLLQQSLLPGHTVPMDSAMVRGLQARVAAVSPDEAFRLPPPDLVASDDHHIDPFDGQRWIAGAAPVGATGYVAIVQTRWDAAVEPNARLSRRFVAVGAGAIVFTAAAAALLALWNRSRAATHA